MLLLILMIILNSNLLNIYMENINQTNIKTHIYYFFNDMINIKNFNPNLLKIDKRSNKNTDIYHIWIHHKKNYDCKDIYGVNPLHTIICEADGYIEESNGNKYLVFNSTCKNKDVLKNTQNFRMGLKMGLVQKRFHEDQIQSR